MPFPNLNDKTLTFTSSKTNNYNPSLSYREKVLEKIQNSPRNNGNYQRSIDLNLTRENSSFRPSSRLRFSNNNSNNLNEPSENVIPRSKTPSIKTRQIVYYNKTYVPSPSDSSNNNSNVTEIQADYSSDDEFNKNFDNVRRHNTSRPNSRESFYHDNTNNNRNSPIFRSKSSYGVRHSRPILPNQNNLNLNNNREFSDSNLSNQDNKAPNNFNYHLTKSINNFNLNSASKTSLKSEENYPVPKPRIKDLMVQNKLNITLNENEDFRVRRNNQNISSRVVTPRTNYIPTPRSRNLNNNRSLNSDGNSNDLENKRIEMTQEYVKFQTQKSPVIQRQTNEIMNETPRNITQRSNRLSNTNVNINFNSSSTDSFTLESENFDSNFRNTNRRKRPI